MKLAINSKSFPGNYKSIITILKNSNSEVILDVLGYFFIINQCIDTKLMLTLNKIYLLIK